MTKALLWGCGLAPVLLLVGCQSSQKLLLPETAAYSSANLPLADATPVSPAADSAATLAPVLTPAALRGRAGRVAPRMARLLTPAQARRVAQLPGTALQGTEVLRLRRAHRQPFRFRHPQDETEGNPWLLALGVVLIAAAIVGGLLIGGGLGIFAGIVVGLLGYYVFMRGLLGPNAWLEAVQELFQL